MRRADLADRKRTWNRPGPRPFIFANSPAARLVLLTMVMRAQSQPSAEVLAVLIDSLASRGRGGPYRTPAPPLSTKPRGSRSVAIAVIGLVLIAVALIAFRRDDAPLADLPAAEREQLLTRTLENLALCERHPGTELRSFCEAQSAILRQLPECDEACHELAHTRYPSRSASARP